MIGRGDDYRVNIFPCDEFLEFFIRGATLVLLVAFDAVKLIDDFLVVLAPRGIHVAYGEHFGIGLVEEIVQQAAALSAGADETERDAVARSFARGSPGRGENERRAQRHGRSGFQELPSIELLLHRPKVLTPFRRRSNEILATQSLGTQPFPGMYSRLPEDSEAHPAAARASTANSHRSQRCDMAKF